MSTVRSSLRWPRTAAGLTLLLILASKAIASYGATITVNDGDKIQDALDIVEPGDTIEIESGDYYEDISTKVDGTADQRITVRAVGGSSNRDNVVLRGAGEDRVFQINHDYYTIESFTIDGEALLEEEADEDNYEEVYRDMLLYVTGTREPTIRDGGYLSALDGLVVNDMVIKNAGGECIRLRYFVTNAEVYGNDIRSCGMYDFVFSAGGKNGEGIYIGTSNKQWGDGKNPTDDPDVCSGNVIRDNTITTEGNEGVEVKEGSVDNIIEDNNIYMQKDSESGGIASRGDRTIIRNNHIEDALGAGVRVGGAEVEGYQYGVDNQVYGNTIKDCRAYGVKIMSSPQGQICGNDIELPDNDDDDDDDYAYAGGSYGDDYDPREDCDSSSEPTPAPPTPSPTSPTQSPTPRTPSPTAGVTLSTSPAPSPMSPTASPTSSSASPTSPTASPTFPTVRITPRSASPTSLTASPTSPTASPTSPTESPISLSSSRTSPAPSPTSPAASPTSPTASPTSPSASPTSPTSPPTSPTASPTSLTASPTSPESSPTSSTLSPASPTPPPTLFPISPTPTILTPSPIEDVEEDPEYIGCFADNPNSTTMTFAYEDTEDMTNKSCIQYCRNKGSRYAGTSNGDRCGCAYSTDRISRNGESMRCRMSCAGDDSEECGGRQAVSTWNI